MINPSPSIEYLQYEPVYIETEIEIGKRLLILSTADKGAEYEPFFISSKSMAIDIFGGGSLIQAYEDVQTFRSNFPVYMMRINQYDYETAYSVLESLDFDLIFLHEVHYNEMPSIIEDFINFCKVKEELGCLIHGITTLSGEVSYQEYSKLFNSIRDLSVENGDDPIENGKYLSIVANQIEFKDAGAVYAGILASLDTEVSPINKTIPNVTLTTEFEKEEILKFREVGIVCFRNTFKKGVTCTSSSCAVSTAGSVHKHISNFRIAQHLINQVSLELRSFIGMPGAAFQVQLIEETVDAVCLDHLEDGMIRDYEYEVKMNNIKGLIFVEIEAIPIFSVHSISTHSHVKIYK